MAEKKKKKKEKKQVPYPNNKTWFKFLMPGKGSGGYKEYLETVHIGDIDLPFLIIVLVLLAFGLIMMYSASYAWAIHDTKENVYDYYFTHQMAFAAGGLAVMALLCTRIFDYHLMKNPVITYVIFIACSALLTVTPFIGRTVGGATRWIIIGGVRFQPSEFEKLAMIILFAHLMASNQKQMKTFTKGILPYGAIMAFIVALMALQPHLSGAIIIVCIGLAMMFVAGVRPDHFIIITIVGTAGMIGVGYYLYTSGFEFIKNRIDGWLHTFDTANNDIAWQTRNSLIAIGSGGWFGLGFGQSRQKNLYLPESQNDFVFSIVCEELGFLGALCVIILFVMLIVRGIYIACHAPDKYGFFLTTGIIVHIGLQAFLNIGVVSNAMPNTGISLPFFSYGGTALILQLVEMGIVLNISKQSAPLPEEEIPDDSGGSENVEQIEAPAYE